MPNTSKLTHAPLKGIALVLSAVVLFATMDTAGKYLMAKFDVPFVSFVRYAINLLLLTALFMPRQGNALWRTKRTSLVVIRGLSLAGATLFFGLAITRLPIGETVALVYLQGFGVMIAAGIFLKEKISAVGWLAAAVGFAGVLLIARPGGALDPLGVAMAIVCAAFSVVYILLSRVLAKTETTSTLLFHMAFWGGAVFLALWMLGKPHALPSAFEWMLLSYIGIGSLVAHFMLTSAYRFAPASMLAPFNYFHIAFAVLSGWLVYDHIPDGYALAGMAMIASAGAAAALYSHLTQSRGQ
jgi:drug/metabolite transporter (DMT)-like permease